MSERDELKRLLDGDVDAGELAGDSILASIAERIYGVSVQPLEVSKPSQTGDLGPGMNAPSGALSGNALDMLIEVVPGGAPAPLPGLPLDGAFVPKQGNSGLTGKLKFYSMVLALLVAIVNLFGMLGALFGGVCKEGICPADGNTRLNWLSIGDIQTGLGWSEPLQTGSFGIPDIALISILLLLILKSKFGK